MADKLTPLQQALRELPLNQAAETLEIVEKLTRNVVRNPAEAKFRKINLTNDKIKRVITDVPNAIELLKEMGWVQQGVSSELPQGTTLELPVSVRFAHEIHVVGIIEAQEYYQTQKGKEHSRQVRAAKEVDSEAAKLREQIQADRQEKVAEGPVTQASKAQRLGNGPNVMRAGDIGIGQSSGG